MNMRINGHDLKVAVNYCELRPWCLTVRPLARLQLNFNEILKWEMLLIFV